MNTQSGKDEKGGKSRRTKKNFRLDPTKQKIFDKVKEIRVNWTHEKVMHFCEEHNWEDEQVNEGLSREITFERPQHADEDWQKVPSKKVDKTSQRGARKRNDSREFQPRNGSAVRGRDAGSRGGRGGRGGRVGGSMDRMDRGDVNNKDAAVAQQSNGLHDSMRGERGTSRGGRGRGRGGGGQRGGGRGASRAGVDHRTPSPEIQTEPSTTVATGAMAGKPTFASLFARPKPPAPEPVKPRPEPVVETKAPTPQAQPAAQPAPTEPEPVEEKTAPTEPAAAFSQPTRPPKTVWRAKFPKEPEAAPEINGVAEEASPKQAEPEPEAPSLKNPLSKLKIEDSSKASPAVTPNVVAITPSAEPAKEETPVVKAPAPVTGGFIPSTSAFKRPNLVSDLLSTADPVILPPGFQSNIPQLNIQFGIVGLNSKPDDATPVPSTSQMSTTSVTSVAASLQSFPSSTTTVLSQHFPAKPQEAEPAPVATPAAQPQPAQQPAQLPQEAQAPIETAKPAALPTSAPIPRKEEDGFSGPSQNQAQQQGNQQQYNRFQGGAPNMPFGNVNGGGPFDEQHRQLQQAYFGEPQYSPVNLQQQYGMPQGWVDPNRQKGMSRNNRHNNYPNTANPNNNYRQRKSGDRQKDSNNTPSPQKDGKMPKSTPPPAQQSSQQHQQQQQPQQHQQQSQQQQQQQPQQQQQQQQHQQHQQQQFPYNQKSSYNKHQGQQVGYDQRQGGYQQGQKAQNFNKPVFNKQAVAFNAQQQQHYAAPMTGPVPNFGQPHGYYPAAAYMPQGVYYPQQPSQYAPPGFARTPYFPPNGPYVNANFAAPSSYPPYEDYHGLYDPTGNPLPVVGGNGGYPQVDDGEQYDPQWQQLQGDSKPHKGSSQDSGKGSTQSTSPDASPPTKPQPAPLNKPKQPLATPSVGSGNQRNGGNSNGGGSGAPQQYAYPPHGYSHLGQNNPNQANQVPGSFQSFQMHPHPQQHMQMGANYGSSASAVAGGNGAQTGSHDPNTRGSGHHNYSPNWMN